MQYVTTRNNDTFYNWLDALSGDRAPDGGFFIPASMPAFSDSEILGFAIKNPNQAIAEILNLFFDTELTRWDIDFNAGRYPVRLTSIIRRITVAEMWHNIDWEFTRTAQDLAVLVRGNRDKTLPIGDWFHIVLRIGVLFSVFGELMRDGVVSLQKKADISLPSSDLRSVMAAWYARQMGLPIGNLIVCCNENNNFWSLVCNGEMRCGTAVKATCTPDCDRNWPDDLERLLYSCGGREEVLRFLPTTETGKPYYPEKAVLDQLQERLHVSVVWQQRVESTIPNSYQSNNYVFGPYSALCYAGLMDYRSSTGSGSYALILSERGALKDDGFVAGRLNMAVQKLHNIL